MIMAKQAHPLGLYLHIPFCRSKCAYCDFYSLSGREDRMDAYTAALERHLIEVAPQAAQHLVDTVYFGGGTPSYLGEKRLVKLLKAVKKHYHVDPHAEITLEANPDSAGDWKALTLAGYVLIMLVMNFGMCIAPILCIFTIKKFDSTLKVAKGSKPFMNIATSALYTGFIAFSALPYAVNTKKPLAIVALLVGGSVRFLCVKLKKRFPFLQEFSMTLSLLLAMVACIALTQAGIFT